MALLCVTKRLRECGEASSLYNHTTITIRVSEESNFNWFTPSHPALSISHTHATRRKRRKPSPGQRERGKRRKETPNNTMQEKGFILFHSTPVIGNHILRWRYFPLSFRLPCSSFFQAQYNPTFDVSYFLSSKDVDVEKVGIAQWQTKLQVAPFWIIFFRCPIFLGIWVPFNGQGVFDRG